MCTPSSSNATRSRPSSGADCHARNCAVVFATNRRLTLLLLVPRLTTPAGSGSRLRAYWRVATPTSICSTTRRFSGSVWASVCTVGKGTSRPPARTRGRWIPTLRPPSTTSLGTVPARDAWRTAVCAYRGPQRAVRSSSSIASSTRRPERTISSKNSAFVSTRTVHQRQGSDGRRFNSG